MCLVAAQFISFYLLRNISNFWLLFAMAYFVGGVANHALMLAIHEISHGMAFGPSKPLANKVLGVIANLPIGVPMSVSFKKYHLEHHRYQGDEKLDTDVPTYMEVSLFTNSMRKTIWCLLQPFFYTLRPLVINPKPIEKMELINILVQLVFDLIVARTLGWHIVAYMIGGSVLAMGLHPVAGHFISEHTLMFNDDDSEKDSAVYADNNNNLEKTVEQGDNDMKINGSSPWQSGLRGKQDGSHSNGLMKEKYACRTVDDNGKFLVPETCSYYGPLNWVTFNVGYHVEHHDFPSIPGSRLHMLSKIAPEFYLNLNYHTSWTNVLWCYITDPKIGPSARVRRPHNIKYSKQIET